MRLLQENTAILTIDIYTNTDSIIDEWIESLSFDITNSDEVQELYYTSDEALSNYFVAWFKNSFFYSKYADRAIFKYEFTIRRFK